MKKIALFVMTAHAVLLGFLFFTPAKKQSGPTKHLVVQTVKPMKIAAYTAPAARTVSKKPTPTKKVEAKKKPIVTEKGKPKPPAKKIAPPEPTVKIETKKETVYPRMQLNVPAKIESLAVDRREESLMPEMATDGSDVIIAYLHQSLHLPEYGEVKVQLTVREDGSVVKLVVLQAESVKNKAYLEKNLPLLNFPYLEKQQTFVFTFCNEL